MFFDDYVKGVWLQTSGFPDFQTENPIKEYYWNTFYLGLDSTIGLIFYNDWFLRNIYTPFIHNYTLDFSSIYKRDLYNQFLYIFMSVHKGHQCSKGRRDTVFPTFWKGNSVTQTELRSVSDLDSLQAPVDHHLLTACPFQCNIKISDHHV